MADWNPRANDIFLKALETASLEERRTLLAEACQGDVELLEQVNRLLAGAACHSGRRSR